MWNRLNKRLLTSFYTNLDITDFNNIDNEKLESVIQKSRELNEFYTKENFKHTRAEKYIRIIELINLNYRNNTSGFSSFLTNSIAEKFLLFLYSVDPSFDAFVIYGSEKDTEKIGIKMTKRFGIYDSNLIELEKIILKKLLPKQKQEELNIKIKKNI